MREYAWFTMSRTVRVRGMEVKTRVSGNLLIAENNSGDEYYGTDLVQGRKALLEPVSTATALDDGFYYTVDAKADGAKLHTASGDYVFKKYNESTANSFAGDATASHKTKYDPAFNSEYQITAQSQEFGVAYGYIDYTFYLKATADATNNEIRLTKCNLSRNDVAINNSGTEVGVNTDLAWRAAVFAVDTAKETTDAVPVASGNMVGNILSLTDAENHDDKWVTGSGTTAAATYNGTAVKIATGLTAQETSYYKVTVRLWLEGQDTTCNSQTYAALQDDSWKLDLQFDLVPSTDTSTPAVTSLGTAAAETFTNNVPSGSN